MSKFNSVVYLSAFSPSMKYPKRSLIVNLFQQELSTASLRSSTGKVSIPFYRSKTGSLAVKSSS